MINKIIHSATKFACFGVAMNVLVPCGLAFLLPDYETHYPDGSWLINRWKRNNGEVFQKAYESIFKKFAEKDVKYKYNSDTQEQVKEFGCFNAYFGTSLLRARPKCEADLEKRIPQVLVLLLPWYLTKDGWCGLYSSNKCIRKVSDMDHVFESIKSNCYLSIPEKNEAYRSAKSCLCTVMSEEFLRKTLTDQLTERLQAYHKQAIDEENEATQNAISDPKIEIPERILKMQYKLKGIPGNTKHVKDNNDGYDVATSFNGFVLTMHIYDIEYAPSVAEASIDEEPYEGRGAYYVDSLDESRNMIESRKNLNIELEFAFDAKCEKIIRVALKDAFIVNAQLLMRINLGASFLLRDPGKNPNIASVRLPENRKAGVKK